MPIVDAAAGSRVEEIEGGLFQIHLPVPGILGGFSFNQYLVVDDEPLLFHTGPRAMAPLVQKAIAHVMPLERLRHIAYSHCESDECGGMNALLAAAPLAVPVTGKVGTMLNADLADRPGRALAHGEVLVTGRRRLRWLDTPHLPHGWECGYLFEESTRTLLCGDLFTQPGAEGPALTEQDVLGPSEALRGQLDYYAHSPRSGALLAELAALGPTTLACMHGSAWRGDGAALLRELAGRIG